MVLIERPVPVPESNEDHSAESNDSAAPETGMNGEAPASRPTVRKRRHSNDADLAKLATVASGASYDQVDSLLGDPSDDSQPAASKSVEPATQEFAFGSAPDQDAPVVAPIGPNQNWSAEATSKSRTYTFYLLAASVGVGLATGVAYLASNRMTRPNVPAPATTIQNVATVDVGENVAPAAQPESKPGTQPGTKPEVPPKLQPSDVADASPLPEKANDDAAVELSAESKAKMDLVDMIPESSPVQNAASVAQPVEPASFEKERPATSTPIDNFGDIGAEDIQPVATESSRPALSQLPALPDSSSHEVPGRRPLPEIDADLRLNDTFSATNLTLGLESMLKFISNASTVPVTIRPEALAWSRMKFDRRVRVIGEDISHAQALEQALKRVKLGYRTDAGHIIVERAAAISGKQVEYSHFIGDLLQVGWTEESLGKLVQTMVVPESWQAAGGQGTINPTKTMLETRGTEAVHFRVMHLLERLRNDHGLAPQRKIADDSDLWREQRNLSQKIPPKRRRAGTLGDMIQEFDRIAGKSIRILPDWHALAKAGWGPDSPAPPTIQQGELDVALREWLSQLQLTYRYAGGGYLEITTPAAEEQRFEVGFHSVKDLVQSPEHASELIRQLKSTIGSNRFQDAGGQSAIHYDRLGGNLIARLPQSGQLDMDWLLRSLRK